MIKLLENTKILLIGLLLITLLTIFFRQSIHNENTIYENYDATYHTLLTIESLKQTPASEHHFLPIVSLGNSTDKNIPWGATIPDKYGNYYYTSFPLGGFFVPYSFFKLFHLKATVHNLFIFSSLILVVSVMLIFLLTQKISKYINSENNPNIPAFLASIIYIFSMETLYSHGFIYWGQSLLQPVYLYFLYIIFQTLTEQVKSHHIYVVFLFSFLLGFIEWSGYLIVFGSMIAIALSKLPKKQKYYYTLACAMGGLLALSVFIFDFLVTVDAETFFQALKARFFARNITTDIPLSLLFIRYWESYYTFLILLPLSLLVVYWNKNKMSKDQKFALILMLIVIMFGLFENLIMKQHAIEYHFDRLKLLPLFALAIPILWNIKSLFAKTFYILVIFITSLYSLYLYPKLRITENSALTENRIFIIEQNLNQQCQSCILGIPQAVRGYTNLLFQRGVYEGQTKESLNEIARKFNTCSCFIDTKGIGGGGMIQINSITKSSIDYPYKIKVIEGANK